MPEAPLKFCRLPLRFDAAALRADLAQVDAERWQSHFNASYHDGGWSGLALRAIDGDSNTLYPDPRGAAPYVDTALLAQCPGLRRALERFQCPLQSVRLLRLAAGGCIREHQDYDLSFEDGLARLHIPLLTNPAVEFYLDGQRVLMDEGECWYLNFNLPHRVQNLGTVDRIHLVVDCEVNDWLRQLMPTAEEARAQQNAPGIMAAAAASAQRQLEQFQALILGDAALQTALQQIDEVERFVAAVVEAGAVHSHRFTAEDVRAAMQANRRAWLERWIVR